MLRFDIRLWVQIQALRQAVAYGLAREITHRLDMRSAGEHIVHTHLPEYIACSRQNPGIFGKGYGVTRDVYDFLQRRSAHPRPQIRSGTAARRIQYHRLGQCFKLRVDGAARARITIKIRGIKLAFI